MREILTIIAACLVAVLTAALVAPPFVDWDAHQAELSQQLSERFGGRAEIGGPIKLRILPAPRLAVGALSLERPGLSLRSKTATLELSATALLRGRFDFTEVSLDRPDVALDPAQFTAPSRERLHLGVERLRIVDGVLRISGAKPLILAHVDLTGSADSLAGPYRGAGGWRGSRRVAFEFSTAPIEDGQLLGKIALDLPESATKIELDGALGLDRGALAFSGSALADGAATRERPPWRAAFALKATQQAAHAEKIEARLGDADHALAFSGSGDYADGGPLALKLTARNLDIDRFLGAHGGLKLSDQRAPIPLALSLSAESATLGGDTLAQSELDLRVEPGKTPVVALDTNPPGQSHLRYAGALDPARWPDLDGRMRLETRDGATLSAYLAPFAPQAARVIAAAPFSHMSASGHVKAGRDGFDAQIDEAELDRTQATGRVSWRPAHGAVRARLSVQATSQALDIDGLPDLSALRGLDVEEDLSLALDAQAIKVARLGQSSADAGRISLRMSRTGDTTDLESLSIAGLGGATLTGVGRATRQGGRLDLKLDAERLADLAAVLKRVAPGAASEALAARATAFSPAHMSLGLATNAAGEFTQVNLVGDAGGAKLSAQLHPAAGDARQMQASLKADAPDAAILLRQVGFAVLPLKGLGRASIEAQGVGALGGSMKTHARASVASTKITFDGETILGPERARASGALAMESADLSPLIQLFSFGAPDLTQKIPLRGHARVAVSAEAASLDDIQATIAGVAARGVLSRRAGQNLTGALTLDSLSASSLAALVVGPEQPAAKGALWPNLKFAPTRIDPPSADLNLAIAHVDLGGAMASDTHMRLSLAPGHLTLRDLAMHLAGGDVAGEVDLRREGDTAMAKASLSADNVAIAAGPFAARITGEIAASGAGASAAELVGSLAGGGHARFADARIDKAAPDALAPMIAAVESEDAPVAQKALVTRLGAALDAGAQTPPTFESDLALVSGRLSLTPVETQIGEATARLSGTLDLRSGAVAADETLTAKPPWDWKGAPPHVDLSWSGPSGHVKRSLTAENLIAALAERAIEREAARNAALEADIRERAYFNRRLKSDHRLDAQRRAEEAAQRKAEEAIAPPPSPGSEPAGHEPQDSPPPEPDRRALEQLMRDPPPMPPARPASKPPPRAPVPQTHAPMPPPRPSAFAPAGRGAAADPSTAGRY